jgi:uncharacterized protein (TIGR00156 family)
MKKRTVAATLVLISTSSLSPFALAQYVGPSSSPAVTVKQLVDIGKDDQFATLQGRLTSRGSEKHFTFDDGTGTLPVKIAAKLFPENQPVSAQTRVEISGEFEKKMFGQPKFDVKEIRLLP